ncbi:MAG: polysaccharide pyruvyl transferase family protein [Paraglaciecola sp.]|uniref:polysaccharide pyruvyl transferase family protein n=1 Tax=Paraglaciecola sp. TaxID=1920173 RepID=UPI003297C3B7
MHNKVIVCTAKYSDNLGDGVISDSVEYLLKRANPNIQVDTLDISGRTHYDNSDNTDTTLVKKVFLNTPEIFRPLVTLIGWFFIFKPRLRTEIKRLNFKQCSLLIFGGGQLINDIALNFPLKMSYITKHARQQQLKYSFNAVGVGQKVSPVGKKLFNSIFKSRHLVSIHVRDNESLQRFNHIFCSHKEPLLTIDSGLWAQETYKLTSVARNNKSLDGRLRIGVGISHPKELAAHSVDVSNLDMIDFWVEIISRITQLNLCPVLFTNGSRDDHLFMRQVVNKLDEHDKLNDIDVLARFKKPEQLVMAIATFAGVLSHRLHANIISHSLNVPSVALAWDKKVQSYFNLIERSEWCYSDSLPPETIVNGLIEAINLGLNQKKIDNLKIISLRNLEMQIRMD